LEVQKKPLTVERSKWLSATAKQKFGQFPFILAVPTLEKLVGEEEQAIQYLANLKAEGSTPTLLFETVKLRIMYLKDIPKILSTDFVKPGIPPLHVVQPKTLEEFTNFEDVLIVAFEAKHEASEVAPVHINMENDQNYVRLIGSAEIDGKQVVCAVGSVISRGNGFATINEMGVIPAARRKGYASEVMKALVKIAVEKMKCKHIVLDATEQGEPTWKSVGFEPVPAFIWLFSSEK